MKHVLLEALLAQQRDCVAVWQLINEDWSREQVRARLPGAGLRPVRGADGVWTATRGRLSPEQKWVAATLTAPDTALSHFSCGMHLGFGESRWPQQFVTVTRPGSGGPRRFGAVIVHRSGLFFDEIVERHDAITVLSAGRTLHDLAGRLNDRALRRAVIEALRIDRTSVQAVRTELQRRPKLRGTRRLADLLTAVEDLPVARCRSNAEATALLRRKEAGRPGVEVTRNRTRCATRRGQATGSPCGGDRPTTPTTPVRSGERASAGVLTPHDGRSPSSTPCAGGVPRR